MSRRGHHLWRGLLRTALSVAFLWAGVVKAWGPHLFASDIAAFKLLPSPALALALAFYLPWVEIGCAVGLWTRRWESGAILLGGSLLGTFSLALASAWARGLRLDCGCFGPGAPGASTDYPLALGRNFLLLAACAVLWWTGPRRRGDLMEMGGKGCGTDEVPR